MKYLRIKQLFIFGLIFILAACGTTPQSTVPLNTNIISQQDLKIGFVYYEPKGKATTHIYGAACLLCYGVASALTSSLDKHLKNTIDNSELDNIKDLVLSLYSERSDNIKVVKLPTPINKLKKFKGEVNFAKKDFRSLREQLDVDVIVVLEIYRHGAHRTFANYIPVTNPKGYVSGLLYSIDLKTNAYIQYLKFDELIQPNGDWDEGPKYPSLTTSYYQAVENVKQTLKNAI